jgi:tRNA modification GTPase
VGLLSERAEAASLLTRWREVEGVRKAAMHLGSALDGIAQGAPEELIAVELRAALVALEHLLGRVDIEEVLDEVFSSFCLGK